MLGRPRTGTDALALEQALTTLRDLFVQAGHQPIDPPHMFLGETLLNLYGEDLRARAFLFPDAERGNELCLRPDFTVPVALAHADQGWDKTAGYAYAGPVFRRQSAGMGRPVEYLQAGIERFHDADPVAAEADILDLLLQGLKSLGLVDVAITVGDLSIPIALLEALQMSDTCRAGLRRHIWRPKRFQDLLRRAVSPLPPGKTVTDLPVTDQAVLELVHGTAEPVGLRTGAEVAERLLALANQVADVPMAQNDADLIEQVFAVKGPAPQALTQLRHLTKSVGVDSAVDTFEARLDALASKGIDPNQLTFDAAFGRNLEYYDGFVFEISRPAGNHPPVAGGGRYDAMTTRLGAPEPVPAIGGMIRPQAALGSVS